MVSLPIHVRRVFLPAVLALGATTLACGGGDGTGVDDGDEIQSVTVTPSTAEIDIGATQQFAAVVTNRRGETVNEPVSWSSTTTAVATVNASSGLATGVSDGTTTIRATAGGVTGGATLTVVDPNPPEAPSDVTAVAVADDAIEVGWTDNSDNETGFVIEREEVGAAAAGALAVFAQAGEVGANATSFRDEGLDPNTGYRYRVQACNDNGCTGGEDGDGTTSDDVTTHEELVMDTESLPDGVIDVAYAVQLSASGGNESFTWTLESGDLPDGLGLSEAGEVSGTPTAEGSFTFTIRVASGEQTVDREFTVEISEQILPPEVTTESLPDGVEGEAYEATLAAVNGDGDYAWEVTDGALPGGLGLSAAGVISGTPTASGSFTFTVQVTSAGMTGSRELTLQVNAALEIETTSLPDGAVGAAYAAAVVASGGDGVLAFSLTGGALPDGVELASDGQLSGTPTAEGTFDFTVRVESGDGQETTAELSIRIFAALSITTTSLPDGETGVAYAATLEASGGDETFTWAVVSGSLPAGVTLTGTTGALAGTPTTAGAASFTVRVTSGDGQMVDQAMSITIAPGAPVITTASLSDGQVGVAYSATLTASGGDGSYAWEVSAGMLPDGLSLSAGGEISGEPTTEESQTFTVQVTSAGKSSTKEFTITIVAAGDPVTIETELLAPSVAGGSYSVALEASGGNGSFTWSVDSGSPPTGVSLGSDGVLTGPPTTPGTFTFTVKAESGGQSDTQELTVEIVPSAADFQFTLFFVTDVPADVMTEVVDAAARWEAIITADIPNVTTPTSGLEGLCDGFGPLWHGTSQDDIGVLMNIASIDGVGGTLASAGGCGFIRGSGGIPYTGYMKFDLDDLSGFLDGTAAGRQQLEDVVFHEMGHVLGIGTRWSSNGLITGAKTANPLYAGAGANGEYTGTYGGSGSIPLENDGGMGTADGHWEENGTGARDVAHGSTRQHFDTEILTGFAEAKGTPMPVSTMTIATVGEMGFSVDLGAADAYSLPSSPNEGGLGLRAGGEIDLRGDILREPHLVLMPDGRIRMIMPDGRTSFLPRLDERR